MVNYDEYSKTQEDECGGSFYCTLLSSFFGFTVQYQPYSKIWLKNYSQRLSLVVT
jgi:hypothetical protein